VAQKISQYQESSLNRIKNRLCGYSSHQFEYQISAIMLSVCIKYSMCDLICDVIIVVFEAATWVKSMYMTKS